MDPLGILVSQVLLLCPDANRNDVERDLRVTGSAEITINRIFDGTFLSGARDERPHSPLAGSSPLSDHDNETLLATRSASDPYALSDGSPGSPIQEVGNRHALTNQESESPRLRQPMKRKTLPASLFGPTPEKPSSLSNDEDSQATVLLDNDLPSNPSMKKRRMSPEEAMRAAQNKQQAKEQRAARLAQAKEEKQRQQELARAAKALSRDHQLLKKRQESFVREMERQYTRNKKDADMFREMTMIVDPGLLEQPGRGKLLDMVRELGVSVSVAKQPVACSVSWQRTSVDCDLDAVRESGACEKGDLPEGVFVECTELEEDVTIVVLAKDVVRWLHSNTFDENILRLREGYPDNRVAILVEGMYAVYRDETNAQKRAYREQVLNGSGAMSNGPGLKVKMDAATLRAQIDMKIPIHLTYDSQETNEMLLAFTKAVSLAPIRSHSTEFSWCTEGVRKSSMSTDIWRAQLTCFVSLSNDVASAIVDAFPSIQLLREAFASAGSERQAIDLLANVQIVRNMSSRRVGPALAERIYRCLMTEDGSLPMK